MPVRVDSHEMGAEMLTKHVIWTAGSFSGAIVALSACPTAGFMPLLLMKWLETDRCLGEKTPGPSCFIRGEIFGQLLKSEQISPASTTGNKRRC